MPDGGFQKKRVDAIREKLGWVELNYAGDGIYSDRASPGEAGEGYNDFADMPRADKFRLPW